MRAGPFGRSSSKNPPPVLFFYRLRPSPDWPTWNESVSSGSTEHRTAQLSLWKGNKKYLFVFFCVFFLFSWSSSRKERKRIVYLSNDFLLAFDGASSSSTSSCHIADNDEVDLSLYKERKWSAVGEDPPNLINDFPPPIFWLLSPTGRGAVGYAEQLQCATSDELFIQQRRNFFYFWEYISLISTALFECWRGIPRLNKRDERDARKSPPKTWEEENRTAETKRHSAQLLTSKSVWRLIPKSSNASRGRAVYNAEL